MVVFVIFYLFCQYGEMIVLFFVLCIVVMFLFVGVVQVVWFDGIEWLFLIVQGCCDVLCGVDFDIVVGEIVVVVGFFGCGKFMFFCFVGGFDVFIGGCICFDGMVVVDVDECIVIVFQELWLFLWCMFVQNVEFGLFCLMVC